ncbi:ATP-grasp domain-containing protein [Bacillus thuringiensis]|nr:ATP-grasp domain-containing protein [Bacillus thuringiensis]
MELGELFDDGVVLDNRPVAWPNTWEREPLLQRDLIASRLLPVISQYSALVPESALHPAILDLYEASGMPLSKNLLVYKSETEHLELIRKLNQIGQSVAIQNPYPEGKIPTSVYAVDRELMIYLNNKANLNYLLPYAVAASRKVTTVNRLKTRKEQIQSGKLAIKAGMAQPSMGGDEVFLCTNRDDVFSTLDRFLPDTRIVIEPWIDQVKNLCIQFTISKGHISYIGAAEQIIMENTRHVGNRISIGFVPPEKMFKQLYKACTLAQCLGYRGVVGFDVLIDIVEGKSWVIDANFRFNGSTTALLASEHLSKKGQEVIFQTSKMEFHLKEQEKYKWLIKMCMNGKMIPLCGTVTKENLVQIGFMLCAESLGTLVNIEQKLMEFKTTSVC